MEKYDFGYREELVKLLTSFSFRERRLFQAKNKLKDYSIKTYSSTVDFLIETLMKEVKAVATEENEYEYCDVWKLLSLF